jgi:hypothetical protein
MRAQKKAEVLMWFAAALVLLGLMALVTLLENC